MMLVGVVKEGGNASGWIHRAGKTSRLN